MKPFDPYDYEAIIEISTRKNQMLNTIDRANKHEQLNQLEEAALLYSEAQHLAYYAGEGLKVKIFNEESDRIMWHKLNDKIEELRPNS